MTKIVNTQIMMILTLYLFANSGVTLIVLNIKNLAMTHINILIEKNIPELSEKS